MIGGGIASARDMLDPQVRLFVERCSAAYAKYGPFDRLPIAEARRVAEEVRAPWRRGGPVMRSTREMNVPFGASSVRVRVYDPGAFSPDDSPRPALIYMHGGDSAGGNLAMAACLLLRDEDGRARASGSEIAGLLLNYAGFEPDCSDEAARRYGGDGFMLSRHEIRHFWANYLRTPDDERNPLACPLSAELTGLPPVLLTIAECDVLGEQNLAMARK